MKESTKLRVTGLWAANSPVTSKFPAQKASGEFPAPRASNAENISIWWRHHVSTNYVQGSPFTGFVVVWLISSIAFRSLTYFLHWQYKQTFFHQEDVIKWKDFPRYWSFVRGIHRSPMDSPHKDLWWGALIFYLRSAHGQTLKQIIETSRTRNPIAPIMMSL